MREPSSICGGKLAPVVRLMSEYCMHETIVAILASYGA